MTNHYESNVRPQGRRFQNQTTQKRIRLNNRFQGGRHLIVMHDL
jgi:hypothetical protein